MEVDTESPSVWFEDGTLIIEAGSVLHRVSRSILAARSSVFKDMLSLPQPPDAETSHGCPIVRLHDSPDDISVFLRAIFDSEFFMPYPAPTTFETVAGILRLSNKYGVDYLRRRALAHLSSFYPTKLSDVDAGEERDASAWKKPSWDDDSVPIHVAAIELAREVDAPWIVPYAFYRAATVRGADSVHDALRPTVPEGWDTTLSADDQKSFIYGYLAQGRSVVTDILRFLYHPTSVEGCTDREECLSERLDAFEYLRGTLATPTNPLVAWGEDDWSSVEICPTCLTSLVETHRQARQAFWDKLPEIYGQPGWEKLDNLKAAAIGDALFR
ncbi:hypothetical protein DFH09DRAFT_56 [Mycena vulgaris]|nr:hypothetical protein DFH09DRAFT_56 [Mycena vulgaris]